MHGPSVCLLGIRIHKRQPDQPMKPNDKTPPGTEPLRPSDSESHFPARSRGSDHIFRTLTEKSFVGMYVA
ncbi:MAG TPA: hypothetical protein P5244_14780, partial [Syntrophales bacterium]|nr:hypothetical protein [Syntrophales bacterium]